MTEKSANGKANIKCCNTCSYFDKYSDKIGKTYVDDRGWGECSFFGQEFYGEGCCRQYQSKAFHDMMSKLIMTKAMRIKLPNHSKDKK